MEAKILFDKLKPMLAEISNPFDSEEYVYEVKWDGYRCLAYLSDTTALKSRNMLSFNERFPELLSLHKCAQRHPLIIDGEIIILDNGIPSFNKLQKRGRDRQPAVFVAFDILLAGDKKLFDVPLHERKEILYSNLKESANICISEWVHGEGKKLFQACIKKDLEGVVAKRLDSLYLPGKRTSNWKKFKKGYKGDFIICGYRQSNKNSDFIDSILLGAFENGQLIYQGMVGVGLSGQAGRQMFSKIKDLQIEKELFKVSRETAKGLTWVKPVHLCSVSFLEPGRDGGLRHPVFQGLKNDLNPDECSGIKGAVSSE